MQFLFNSGESHAVVRSFTHIQSGLQQFVFKNFNSYLKYAVLSYFKQNYCISSISQGIPIQFLLNSGESHVVATSFTHIHSGFQQILIMQKFQ